MDFGGRSCFGLGVGRFVEQGGAGGAGYPTPPAACLRMVADASGLGCRTVNLPPEARFFLVYASEPVHVAKITGFVLISGFASAFRHDFLAAPVNFWLNVRCS